MKRARSSMRNHEYIYEALHAAGGPMSAYELLDRVREHGISAPPTVYRALDYLVEKGRVHRLESINAYVACSDPDGGHCDPVFAICTRCKAIEELPGGAALAVIDHEAKRAGFAVHHATIEVQGYCRACLKALATLDAAS
ncbi:Fur family transcriptional regulator [Acuticoccus mangrovi]|uniref:Ferric uptake regulation protein n=1 Tax=Acuticoccus mangrovi TaxID=2796142 RepID=A0A934ISX9_9HYPH|nr:Fur family transcriptional regulator [Acuticoccus mangrovi]MBJ3778043.1 transcriptional repressor [Acuticoccus mangrovi]